MNGTGYEYAKKGKETVRDVEVGINPGETESGVQFQKSARYIIKDTWRNNS